MKRLSIALILLIVAGCLCVVPSMATSNTKYLYGSVELTAVVDGTNEFSPGDDVSLSVKVQNQGINTVKLSSSTILARDETPTLAKMVTLTLEPGDAPVVIKSGSQMVGDIESGETVTATFTVKIDKDAPAGTYSLPLDTSYRWLFDVSQYDPDTIVTRFYDKNESLPLEIVIRPDVTLKVDDVQAEAVNVGTEGYLNLKVTNIGTDEAKKATVVLKQNDASPVVPTIGSVYIGDFGPGDVKEVQFKVTADNNAEAGTYPVDVSVTYEDYEGDMTSSDAETIGVPVGGKIDFTVVSDPTIVSPGGKSVVEVIFKNSGAATVYDAQARISAVDPFTSNDDSAYLGDMNPGEEKLAKFDVSVDSDATEKLYGLDAEIRYRDALDNSQISDTMKVKVDVQKKTGAASIFTNPIVITIVIFVILGAGYYLFQSRKKKNEQ